jgi:hypothetical protein
LGTNRHVRDRRCRRAAWPCTLAIRVPSRETRMLGTTPACASSVAAADARARIAIASQRWLSGGDLLA